MAKDLNLHERLISELGVVLQERRARLHMSQSDLAESSRFHRSYISDVERGARNISVKKLESFSPGSGYSSFDCLSASGKTTFVQNGPYP